MYLNITKRLAGLTIKYVLRQSIIVATFMFEGTF